MRLVCQNEDCGAAWLLIIEKSSQQYAEIKFERKIEFLKEKKDLKLTAENTSQKLLLDALTYGFPVERHSANVSFGSNSDVLVVQYPPVDVADESFDDTTNPGEATSLSPKEKPLELEATDSSLLKTAPKKTELDLTDNLNAVYNVQLPKRFFKSSDNFISDPLLLNTSFSIKPINAQQNYEPAYRIGLIAKSFVDQGVKIYQNACNIFVRAVMNLSGYTSGGNFSANEFNKLFTYRTEGLSLWERDHFKNSQTPHAQVLTLADLAKYLKALPADHAAIVRVDRTQLGQHGHVGILIREGSDVVIYDSSLRNHGPRRSVVKKENIVNPSRQQVIIYSMPGMVSTPNMTTLNHSL